MKTNNPLTVTPDRRVQGVFKMHDQEGFSLTDCLIQCHDRNLRPDWMSFYADAKKARDASGGKAWTWEKTEKIVREALTDANWPQTLHETTWEAVEQLLWP